MNINGTYKIQFAVFWLVLMMAIPNVSNVYKYIGLAVLLLYTVTSDKFKIHIKKSTLITLGIWILFFTVSLFNAFLNGFEFNADAFAIYFIRPICILVLCSTIETRENLLSLVKALVYITLFVSIYNMLVFLGEYGIIPNFLGQTGSLTIIDDSFLTTRTGNQTALMFLTAFMSQIFLGKNYFKKEFQIIIGFSFFLSITVSILSGRRALQIVTILFVLLSIVQNIVIKKGIKNAFETMFRVLMIAVLLVTIVVLLSNYFNFNVFESIRKTISDAFSVLSRAHKLRDVQKKYLLSNWMQRPFLGWGMSAYVQDYIEWKHAFTGHWQENRSSYEYFYHAFLFQNGIIGVSIVTGILGVVFTKLWKAYLYNIKNIYGVCIIAIIYGSLSFLAAGYSNPLVTSMWMWYILFSVYFAVEKEL